MEIGGNRFAATLPPDHSIKSMAAVIGELPPGDSPGAWWSSTYPQVTTAYDEFVAAKRTWNDRYAHFLKQSGLPPNTQFVTEAGVHRLMGVVAPPGFTESTQRWLRYHKNGTHLLPRKRTLAEKNGPVARLWEELEYPPHALEFVPGMPAAIVTAEGTFPVTLRKPAQAVLAFLGLPPERATEPFLVNEYWSRMKVSTFQLLRERQAAAAQVP